jgi:hypothetical protein
MILTKYQNLWRNTMDKKITLKVNDREIPLNPFVTDLFFNVINGLVDSLNKVPEEKDKIELIIKKEGKK